MGAAPNEPSSRKPKSPRRQPSKQSTPADQQKSHQGFEPSSASMSIGTLRQKHEPAGGKQTAVSGTFLAESPRMEDGEEVEDPHDLALSKNHVLRASMVDNLVLSLDSFSGGTSEEAPYTPRSNSYDTSTRVRGRGRGHTFSSSTSSDNDIQHLGAVTQLPHTIPRVPVRGSGRYQKDLQKLPSIFGEDEDATRVKVYEAQRAAQPLHPRRKHNTSTGGKSAHSSNSSSIDLGHLATMNGRLGAPGNRRSRSFDFGSRQRETLMLFANDKPNPVIYSGPEAQNTTPASPLVPKNSTKSTKSTHVKKTRPPLTVTGTSRTESVPQLPSVKSVPSLYAAERKPSLVSPHEPLTISRPGFFRRVFGSRNPTIETHSAPSVLTESYPGRATPLQEENFHPPATPAGKVQRPIRRTSTDASANKENQPIPAKKSSTFFRRRKKSISDIVLPPLPLTLNAELTANNEPANGTSPVSSLRAFMGPYLADSPPFATGHAHPRGHVRTNSLQGFYTPDLPPAAFGLSSDTGPRPKADHSRNESHGSSKTLKSATKHPTTLRIPHQDSFLADSSSAEGSIKPSPFDSHFENGRVDLPHRNSENDLNLEHTTSARSLPSRLPNPRSATTGQGSWISDTISPGSSLNAPIQDPKRAEQGPIPVSARRQNTLEVPRKPVKGSPYASMSDVSDEYRSAPSTPLITETPDGELASSVPSFNSIAPLESLGGLQDYMKKARQIYSHVDDEVDSSSAGAWLGEDSVDRGQIRKAYMELFDWANQDILDSLRKLCDRIALRGESQVIDRILISFAQRWCECNPGHIFKSTDAAHQICYAILLLNTDLHLADIGQKMTRVQFTRNALATIRRNAPGSEADNTLRGSTRAGKAGPNESDGAASEQKRSDAESSREEPAISGSVILDRGWELQMEAVLKSFYNSISQEPLPLFGAPVDPSTNPNQPNNFLTIGMLRRTPSVLSKAQSENTRSRFASESRSLGARFIAKTRSRPRLPSAPGFNSSRTSIDESSAWSPSISSTWSKASLGKTLTSMSVDSFGTEATHADYQSSIGFANALSQAIIREDHLDLPIEDGSKAGSLLEDESLELHGAPWAKEGILKHKCHLEGVDKRSKDRNWNDCFAVIEKGYMRLFSFTMTAKSLRNKARAPKPAVVGGGNWQDNAEELWKFTLRHTIASSLPPPGYSKARPYVWALSLPTGAVHLFSVGTPDIVKEFVSSANFWSARLSKEPMMGGISNMEYGWSDTIVAGAHALDNRSGRPGVVSPRPGTQMSMRSSMDQGGGVRGKLPADKIHINDWSPPQQSMFASQLMEVDQLRALQTYVSNVEEELQKHNDLRGSMLLAFTPKHPNSNKAMNNWERKSSYLLREIVKFRTYIDTLQNAQATKEKIYRMRREGEEARQLEAEACQLEADARMRTDAANALMGVSPLSENFGV